jgi:hypothetical protein
MKKTILLLIFTFITINCFAQIEILVFGTAHENGAPDYSKIISKLKKFNPDRVFGETLNNRDFLEMPSSYFENSSLFKTRKKLMQNYGINTIPSNTDTKIAKAEFALLKNPNLHSVRIGLAKNYIINADRGNIEYEFWKFKTSIYNYLGPSEIKKFNKEFGSIDSLQAWGLFRPVSEYTKIVFPLMHDLKLSKIYAMDCQKYDTEWNKAWEIVDAKINAIKKEAAKDSNSQAALVNKKAEVYFDSLSKVLETSKLGWYTQMNQSEAYFEADEATNFYGGKKMYSVPGYPTEDVKKMYGFWVKRNEGMAKNIMDRIESKPNQRILVAVGSSHKHILDGILATYPNVKIVKWEDL